MIVFTKVRIHSRGRVKGHNQIENSSGSFMVMFWVMISGRELVVVKVSQDQGYNEHQRSQLEGQC